MERYLVQNNTSHSKNIILQPKRCANIPPDISVVLMKTNNTFLYR
jgi:hypothetical protein